MKSATPSVIAIYICLRKFLESYLLTLLYLLFVLTLIYCKPFSFSFNPIKLNKLKFTAAKVSDTVHLQKFMSTIHINFTFFFFL